MLEEFGDAIARTSAEISVGPLPVVAGNPVAMHQVYRNLIGNALEFTLPRQSPVIHVSARTAETGGHRV